MEDPNSIVDNSSDIPLDHLKPFFSITILNCVTEDVDEAFEALIEFLRSAAGDAGRAHNVEQVGELNIGPADSAGGQQSATALRSLGFDRLYLGIRRRSLPPSWATAESLILDTVNELTLALGRERLVAIRTDVVTPTKLLRWADRLATPYESLTPEVMQGTFTGDGTMVWLQGVHQQRSTKPNSKALGGTRLQDAYDAIDDATYALTALRVKYIPDDEAAVLAGQLTISADRSHLSAKAMRDLPMFIAATDEALSMLAKSIDSPQLPTLDGYATRERVPSRVHSAYDIRVIAPEEVPDESDRADLIRKHAELLRGALIRVAGDPTSRTAIVEVGCDGTAAGRLELTPTPIRGRVALSVTGDELGRPGSLVREVGNLLRAEDIVSIYYASGHTFVHEQLYRQRISVQPFAEVTFEDFDGFDVGREKPVADGERQIHRAIARDGDRSLFGWVVKKFDDGWLICDDGPKEIADFLHLGRDGTLKAIHVKAAYSTSPRRRIAVTSFEQVVSQAEKNVTRLERENLLAELLVPRNPYAACWTDGRRVANRNEFLRELARRPADSQTYVILVQPHLTESRHAAARAEPSGSRSLDVLSLALLDNLLHSTRRTVTSICNELIVVGARG